MADAEIIWMWDGRNASDSEREIWEAFKDAMREATHQYTEFLEVQTNNQLDEIREKLESNGWKIGLGGSGAFWRMFPWEKYN